MAVESLLGELESTKDFFETTVGCLTEENSEFVPVEGMMSVAGQVAHVAHTVEWFVAGAFERPEGMDMDFAAHAACIAEVKSLAAANEWLQRAFAKAASVIGAADEATLASPITGPIMGGQPKSVVVTAIGDHTAHHRGALAVYARLCGLTPPMPYA